VKRARRASWLLVGVLALATASCTSSSNEGPSDGAPVLDAPSADGGAPNDATQPFDATLANDAGPEDATLGSDGTSSEASVPDTGAPSDAIASPDTILDAGTDAATWSATIGPAGGTLVHPLGATLTIPAGAVATAQLIVLTPVAPPANATVVGPAFTITPPGLTFAVPAQLTLSYSPSALGDASSSSLAIEESTDNGSTFEALSSAVDKGALTVAASTITTGVFAPIVTASGGLFVTTASPLPGGNVGVAYSTEFAATGGTSPYAWSMSAGSSPPPGLTLASNGILSGAPTTVGVYSFFVRAADSNAHVTQAAFSLTVGAAYNPLPTLTSITPTSGGASASISVAVVGTNFVPQATVTLSNGSSGTSLAWTWQSATQLTAEIAGNQIPSAGNYALTVTNPAPGGGTSNALVFTALPTNPVPYVTTLSPTMAPTGSPDTQITIAGGNFISSSAVLSGGATISSSFLSASQLLAILPAADLVDAGEVAITVQNPLPGGGTSNVTEFVVGGNADGTPVITSIVPSSTEAGAPITFTLYGSGFVYGYDPVLPCHSNGYVLFGGVAIQTAYVSSTQVTGTIHPTQAMYPGTFDVTYANAANGYTPLALGNTLPFTINPAPDGGCSGGCLPSLTCFNDRCCVMSGLIGSNGLSMADCCSSTSVANACTSSCAVLGQTAPANPGDCCVKTTCGPYCR
jgi:hypothetical protein